MAYTIKYRIGSKTYSDTYIGGSLGMIDRTMTEMHAEVLYLKEVKRTEIPAHR